MIDFIIRMMSESIGTAKESNIENVKAHLHTSITNDDRKGALHDAIDNLRLESLYGIGTNRTGVIRSSIKSELKDAVLVVTLIGSTVRLNNFQCNFALIEIENLLPMQEEKLSSDRAEYSEGHITQLGRFRIIQEQMLMK
ncbi:MAG TPA: hypothetical protein VNI77_00405 [Nitrososphaera sp.]|nr:hypothetical protein [Nitrososphaera sp.]